MDLKKVINVFEKYAKPDVNMEYGTAGFRTKATLLNHVAARVGIVACLRSMHKKKVVGLMITASHNLETDNGVKIVDPDGGMLENSWEKIATDVVNCELDSVESTITSLIKDNVIDVSYQGTVILGWDTRKSSEPLANIAQEGISSLNGVPQKICLCTTPVLHYVVRCNNDPSYGTATADGYYEKLLTTFKALWTGNNSNGNYVPEVYFDGANGVGVVSMEYANKRIKDKLNIKIFNDAIERTDILNVECGADYVKQKQTFPKRLPTDSFVRCVSFDGDADRIIYHYLDDKKQIHILDGDRMATLIATYLEDILKNVGLHVSLGIVQTAYANGSSTKFITKKLKLEVAFANTGIKNLYIEALKYDIGVYFEANGHGTAVFNKNFKCQLCNLMQTGNNEQKKAANELKLFVDLVNETIGDAFSDFLIIETILHKKGWSLQDWEKLYDMLPYKMSKLTVKDRSVIVTKGAECKCISPEHLQEKIDELVGKYKNSRAFVRPSGTEDIVRVYAEASTQEEADELALKVSQLVYDMADGTGERPH